MAGYKEDLIKRLLEAKKNATGKAIIRDEKLRLEAGKALAENKITATEIKTKLKLNSAQSMTTWKKDYLKSVKGSKATEKGFENEATKVLTGTTRTTMPLPKKTKTTVMPKRKAITAIDDMPKTSKSGYVDIIIKTPKDARLKTSKSEYMDIMIKTPKGYVLLSGKTEAIADIIRKIG